MLGLKKFIWVIISMYINIGITVLKTTKRSCQIGRNKSSFIKSISLIKNRGEGGSPNRKKKKTSNELLFILMVFT